ncbi:MAG TPA: tetratricopeptide repeat protein, partial [Polyangiales bacterium]|nr:tetratricopeptide repeat protein [Polyangiales bacterium]
MTSSDLDLRLLRFRSRRDEVPHALASALIEAGRSSDALEVIHLGLLDDERDIELVTLEGRAFYAQGDLPQAQRSLLRAARINPRHKEPYRWLAQVLIERGDAVRAVQVLERALAIDANDPALKQALTRAQRLVALHGKRPSEPRREPQPASEPPKKARPSLRASVASPLTNQPRASSATPSALGPSVKSPAANQNSSQRGSQPRPSQPRPVQPRASEPRPSLFQEPARAREPARAPVGVRPQPQGRRPELAAEDLLQEPLTQANGRPWEMPTQGSPLPFDDETDRDEDSPTTAVEIPDELRERLRHDPASQVLGSDDPDDDNEKTAIVDAERELQVLADRESVLRRDNDRTQEVDERHLTDISQHYAAPGEAEPPEEVLKVLHQQGVFEAPQQRAQRVPEAWTPTAELPRVGTPIKRALAVGWGLALVAALAGYFGFQAWLDGRRAEAASVIETGLAQAADGQYESLLAAERTLSDARALDPRSQAAIEALLYVQAARALEDGDAPYAGLRDAVGRADQVKLESPLAFMARALIKVPDQRKQELSATLAYADKEAAQDARATYVAARIAQRSGNPEAALKLFARATSLGPQLALSWLGLGEQQRAEGQLDQAHESFGRALGPDKLELRAELWLLLIEARSSEGAALLEKLDKLSARLARGSQAERLLGFSARAFATLATGDADSARQALEVGANLHVDDPELLAFYSEQALRAGEHSLAYRSARAASAAGGDAARYQGIVAAALLQQGDGDAALTALANLGGQSHGALALARASAALLSDAREPLEAAKKELASYRQTPLGKDDPEASSLLMRVDLRLGANVESLLPAARSLVQRAPELPASHLALAEALVKGGQGAAAVAALEPALKLAPGSSEAHFLLGRAQLLAGKPADARASFERAVAIAPNHVEARRSLGRSLLDSGDFDAALALFRGLESSAGGVATLGVAEALIGKGNLSDAASKLDGLREPIKSSPSAVVLRARIELAKGQPQAAIGALAPLLAEDAETRTADTLALQGDALLTLDKWDEAAGLYDAALELDEAQPDALIGRAQAALRTGRVETVLPWITRANAALVQHPRPPSVRAALLTAEGRVALLKGDGAGAHEKL